MAISWRHAYGLPVIARHADNDFLQAGLVEYQTPLLERERIAGGKGKLLRRCVANASDNIAGDQDQTAFIICYPHRNTRYTDAHCARVARRCKPRAQKDHPTQAYINTTHSSLIVCNI